MISQKPPEEIRGTAAREGKHRRPDFLVKWRTVKAKKSWRAEKVTKGKGESKQQLKQVSTAFKTPPFLLLEGRTR